MQTENDIMKNLNTHLEEEKNKKIPSPKQVKLYPQMGDFKKQNTNPAKFSSKQEDTAQENRRRQFTYNHPNQKRNKNYFTSARPDPDPQQFPGFSNKNSLQNFGLQQQQPLKESHFYEMIDMIQKESEQMKSEKELLPHQKEDYWWDAISKNKQY
jgi:hypothetical protein